MERKSYSAMQCSIAQCLEVIGEWWTILIIRDLFLGFNRFDIIQQRLGVSRNILQNRLVKLEGEGLIRREQYLERPPRFEYHLTEVGRDLWPILESMRQWGDQYRAPNGAPMEVRHRTCGEVGHSILVCEHCGLPTSSREVEARLAERTSTPANLGAYY